MPDNQTVSHSRSIFDQKNHFNFQLWFNLRCCQSPILAIIMKIPKMAKIVYRQRPAPRDLLQQIPTSRAKAGMQKPQGGEKFLVQIPGGARGVVMEKIDGCITCFRINPDQALLRRYWEGGGGWDDLV